MIKRLYKKYKESETKKQKAKETRSEFKIINNLIDKFQEEGNIQVVEILLDAAEIYLDEIIRMRQQEA